MLRRMVSDPAPDSSGRGGDGRPRGGGALFAVPRLFVGFAAKRVAPDAESSRSPTSPLDPKALLLRSPRSPRMTWGAPGLVDALAADNAAANCLLSPRLRVVRTHSSPPKDCGGPGGGGHSQPELGKTMSCPAPDTAAASGAGGMSVPCSRFVQFHRHGDLKSGPEATGAHLVSNGSKRHSFDLGSKLPGPGSLPASSSRRFVGSVSASEIEQSEDYTRIIARGPNPKTTHIFGDCILEPRTVGGGGDEAAAMESKEGAAGCCYFVVKSAAEAAAGADDFLSSCFACKKKLEGNDIYIYRGEKAFCSANCRDQEIQLEEEAENNTGSASPRSSCSSIHDDIFMAGMVVAT